MFFVGQLKILSNQTLDKVGNKDSGDAVGVVVAVQQAGSSHQLQPQPSMLAPPLLVGPAASDVSVSDVSASDVSGHVSDPASGRVSSRAAPSARERLLTLRSLLSEGLVRRTRTLRVTDATAHPPTPAHTRSP